jgi:hypothetical protein
MTDGLTKVHIDLPNHWAAGGESIWARDLGGARYRIENVPFYAYNLNFYDVVEARALGPELKPSVMRVLERSGHQTVRVNFDGAVTEGDQIDRLNSLADLHVSYERCNRRYFALDLEPEASLDLVRSRLDQWETEGVLGYETCEARIPGSFDAEPSDDDSSS